jgi:hypothetical protein
VYIVNLGSSTQCIASHAHWHVLLYVRTCIVNVEPVRAYQLIASAHNDQWCERPLKEYRVAYYYLAH